MIMEDDNCYKLHPESARYQPLDTTNPRSPCLNCNLSILSSSDQPLTVSISAASTIALFTTSQTSCIQTFSSTSIKSVVHRILTQYLHQPHLRPTLESVPSALTILYDKSHPNDEIIHSIHFFLVNTILSILTSVPTSLHSPAAQILTYILNNHPFETKPCLFSKLSADQTLLPRILKSVLPAFPSFTSLLQVTAKSFPLPSSVVADLLSHLVKTFPLHPHPPADEAFLSLTSASTCDSNTLLAISAASSILRRTILSKSPQVRHITSKILIKLIKHSPQTVVQWRILEYTVEALKDTTYQVSLLLPPLQVLLQIMSTRPKATSFRWSFSLIPVLKAAQSLNPHPDVHRVTVQLISIACQYGPPPIFVKGFKPLMDFVMNVCTLISRKIFNFEEGRSLLSQCVSSICTLLAKFRPSITDLHYAITVAEALTHPSENIQQPCLLIISIISHFIRLVDSKFIMDKTTVIQDSENDTDITLAEEKKTIRDTGHRLLLLVFHTWAGILERMLSASNGCKNNVELSSSSVPPLPLERYPVILQMLTNGLDKAFTRSNACSETDRNEMRNWCWCHFPPRRIFPLITFDDSSDSPSNLQHISAEYMSRISFTTSFGPSFPQDTFPLSKKDFLEGLAHENPKTADSSLHMLATGIFANGFADNIVTSLETYQALKTRLAFLSASSNLSATISLMRVARLLVLTSSRHKIPLDIETLSETAIMKVLSNSMFDVAHPQDQDFLYAVLTCNCSDTVTVQSWDLFSVHLTKQRILSDPAEIAPVSLLENEMFYRNFLRALFSSKNPETIADPISSSILTSDKQRQLARGLGTPEGNHIFSLSITTFEDLLLRTPGKGILKSGTDLALACRRITSFLRVAITSDGNVAFTASPNVIASVIQILNRITEEPDSELAAMLNIALIRFLTGVFITDNSEDYMEVYTEGTLLKIVIRILSSEREELQRHSDVASCSTALLAVLLDTAKKENIGKQKRFCSKFITNDKLWERFLGTITGPQVADHEPRLINACFLLSVLYRRSELTQSKELERLITPNILVLVCLIAGSFNVYLSEAAYEALTAINTFFKSRSRNKLPNLFVHKKLYSFTATNLFSSIVNAASPGMLSYFTSVIEFGHYDVHLRSILDNFLAWLSKGKDSQKLSARCIQQNLERMTKTKLARVAILFKAIDKRVSLKKVDIGTRLVECQQELKSTLDFLRKINEKDNVKTHLRFFFGKYTVVWNAWDEDEVK